MRRFIPVLLIVLAACAEQAAPTIASADDHRALAAWQAPLLLPSGDQLRAAAFLTAGPTWYAASIKQPGLTITIEANNVAFERPHVRAAMPDGPPARGAPRVGRNEDIMQADFVTDGVAWTVAVECHEHESDRRCTESAYVRQLVADLSPWQVPEARP